MGEAAGLSAGFCHPRGTLQQGALSQRATPSPQLQRKGFRVQSPGAAAALPAQPLPSPLLFTAQGYLKGLARGPPPLNLGRNSWYVKSTRRPSHPSQTLQGM